jgi:hypothetical protein
VVHVVKRDQPRPEWLAALEQVVKVGPGEALARRAATRRVERLVDRGGRPTGQRDPPRRREGGALPGQVGRQDAVEHVDAGQYRVEQIGRRADPHQVARPIGRQELRRHVRDLLALGARISDREPADGQPVERVVGQKARRLGPQRRHHAALHDGEQRLGRIGAGRQAAQRPPVGPLHGVAGGRLVRPRVDADVEHHHDVGPDGSLHLDGPLRRQDMHALVDVAAEGRTGLADGPLGRQREDLVAARVGQDRPAPAHEAVDAAHPAKQLDAGAEHEVVRVGEDDLDADPGQIRRVEPGDGRARAHRHEHGSVDPPVPRRERTAPRARSAVDRRDREAQGHRGPV